MPTTLNQQPVVTTKPKHQPNALPRRVYTPKQQVCHLFWAIIKKCEHPFLMPLENVLSHLLFVLQPKKLGDQLYQRIKWKYPQYVAKLTGMILTMSEGDETYIRNLLINSDELDRHCETLVQLLRSKQVCTIFSLSFLFIVCFFFFL
ncbi:polyadenylate binding protein [Reticulomyxa filosa]|uniref:Polyadenylate binding protein n=1 Tax=Reticulomyxa filosa TaxID=46433 RepID=X6P2U4_RETFI|nr:polyadenylate binding protein [Reticulomyxa filosa]|eukprot:ETO32865.1 polyadenylate binding protein [Reticulomyxa filosa]